MSTKVKISSSYSGKIPTGSYENANPGFAAEVEIECPDGQDVEKFIADKQTNLQKICYGNFKNAEDQAVKERIEKERKDIRWYEGYPSVTSVIGWDADFFVSQEDLQQYASQGNLIDLQVKHFIETGEWTPIEKIEGSWADLVIVKKGSLGLSTNGWSFTGFLEKHPIEGMEVGSPVISHKHKYGGTPDISICMHDGLRTLADVKRTPDRLKHFKQTAAYIKALEENGAELYEQMMLIPLNDKTQQGYSKPLISTEINQYFEMFLKDRENFKKRFGV